MQNYYRSLNAYNDPRAVMVAKMYEYPRDTQQAAPVFDPNEKEPDIVFYPKKDTICNKKGNNFYYRGVT